MKKSNDTIGIRTHDLPVCSAVSQPTELLRAPMYVGIPIYIKQDTTLHNLFYLETALHVSGCTSTHHQECIQLYLQHLVFVTPLVLPADIVEELECSSNSFTIVAGSSNGVTNTRCCRYSCMHS